MPRISAFYGIVIKLWYNDHAQPHFHATYAEHKAKVEIASGELIKGFLPPRALRLVREWTLLHRDELTMNWDLARRKLPLVRIEPLP